MKLSSTLAIAMLAAAPAVAQAQITLDFEGAQGYVNPIGNFYNGGTDSLGQSGPNYGVSFGSGVLGLSNDALGPYFSNAPSPLTAVFSDDGDAYLNFAPGFVGALTFVYSSVAAVANAVSIYSGLDGTGALLGSINLAANASLGCTGPLFCNFDDLSLQFAGVARSVDFGGGAPNVLYDDFTITPVPEPETYLLMLGGLAAVAGMRRRRKAAAA